MGQKEANMRLSKKPVAENFGSWKLSELSTFYVKNRPEFFSHARRLLGDSARAEEVVHEALLKVMLAAPELISTDHAKAYVHRTVENLCRDIFRIEGRRPALFLLDEARDEIERKSYALHLDYSEILAEAEDASIVRRAISLLSPAERAAIVMWEIEERSTSEIASELGIQESAVKHTISRARNSLRRILASIVIDEQSGLTGLDLLSRSYKVAKTQARKSSKVALSILFILFAISGFQPVNLSEISSDSAQDLSAKTPPSFSKPFEGTGSAFVNSSVDVSSIDQPPKASNPEDKLWKLKFPGLNKSGIPEGFSIADSTGALGPAYFRDRASSSPNSYLSSSQIIKTESIAANVFIAQTLSTAGDVISYSPTVSYGRSGEWVPLLVSVARSETRRLPDGNYLFTVRINVDSEVEFPVRIAAKANGRDLESAPSSVVMRLLLDSGRTRVLSQAVYVLEKEAGA
jgi:RNA polymerase sigma factor (sigma-70 family)